jgi:hypothetical protein
MLEGADVLDELWLLGIDSVLVLLENDDVGLVTWALSRLEAVDFDV